MQIVYKKIIKIFFFENSQRNNFVNPGTITNLSTDNGNVVNSRIEKGVRYKAEVKDKGFFGVAGALFDQTFRLFGFEASFEGTINYGISTSNSSAVTQSTSYSLNNNAIFDINRKQLVFPMVKLHQPSSDSEFRNPSLDHNC